VVDVITSGAAVGVFASGAFVWLEMGRYAEPQVSRTLFDERKELFAYTAGLFVGVILAVLYVLVAGSLDASDLVSAALWIGVVIAVLEFAQWVLGRSVYFGSDHALPFYVLGYRAGAAGILGLTVVALYLTRPQVTVLGGAGAVGEAVAFVLLLAAAGIQSTPRGPPDARRPGAVGRGVILEAVGFLLLGFGTVSGDVGQLVAAVAVAGMSLGLYLTIRDEVLGNVRPPPRETGPDGAAIAPPGRFGRQDGRELPERSTPPP
jgi:hypothetical protein